MIVLIAPQFANLTIYWITCNTLVFCHHMRSSGHWLWSWIFLSFHLLSSCLSPFHFSMCSITPSSVAYVFVSVAPPAPSPSPHLPVSGRPPQRPPVPTAAQGAPEPAPQWLHEHQTQNALPAELETWGKFTSRHITCVCVSRGSDWTTPNIKHHQLSLFLK